MTDRTFGELYEQRYGTPVPADLDGPVAPGVARILDRRVVRQLESTPIEPALMAQLLACAQSAPTKSDLQQYSIVIVEDAAKREQILEWIPNMPFIAQAGTFLIFCGDIRRNRKLGDQRGHRHVNDNLDSFFNATVDGSLAMQSFILGAEAAGLACTPVSYIRNHASKLATLLDIPNGVFPIAGLAVGKPIWAGKPSTRLPQSVVVHRDRYDDSKMAEGVAAYDEQRHVSDPIAPEKQRHTDHYGVTDKCVWSEQISRQLSFPERPDFRPFIEAQGFSLK
jgi:FMN reductase [NAD(P)H]